MSNDNVKAPVPETPQPPVEPIKDMLTSLPDEDDAMYMVNVDTTPKTQKQESERDILCLMISHGDKLSEWLAQYPLSVELFDDKHKDLFTAISNTWDKDKVLLTRKGLAQWGKDNNLTPVQLQSNETLFNAYRIHGISVRQDDYPMLARKLTEQNITDIGISAMDTFRQEFPKVGGRVAAQNVYDKLGAVLAQHSVNNATNDMTRLSDIVQDVKPIQWLWQNRIPLGNVSVVYGQGGTGKSHIGLYCASIVSNGTAWFDKSDCPLGGALIISGEDGKNTIVPRLTAMKANIGNISTMTTITQYNDKGIPRKVGFTLNDLPELERNIKCFETSYGIPLRLIVIDPVGSFMGTSDSHKDSEVRAIITPLSQLAEKYNIAIVLVAHVNKSKGQKAQDRLSGSVGFSNAPRSTFMVLEAPDNNGYVMAHVKLNDAKKTPSARYRISGETVQINNTTFATSCIEWLEEINMTANELVAANEEIHTKVDKAEEWLEAYLQNGAKASNDILDSAKKQGYSRATIWKAKERLGSKIKCSKAGYQGKWNWKLADTFTYDNSHNEEMADILAKETEEEKAPESQTEDYDILDTDRLTVKP